MILGEMEYTGFETNERIGHVGRRRWTCGEATEEMQVVSEDRAKAASS